MVRQGRFELPRCFHRQPLKLVRLPVPPLPQSMGGNTKVTCGCQRGVFVYAYLSTHCERSCKLREIILHSGGSSSSWA